MTTIGQLLNDVLHQAEEYTGPYVYVVCEQYNTYEDSSIVYHDICFSPRLAEKYCQQHQASIEPNEHAWLSEEDGASTLHQEDGDITFFIMKQPLRVR